MRPLKVEYSMKKTLWAVEMFYPVDSTWDIVEDGIYIYRDEARKRRTYEEMLLRPFERLNEYKVRVVRFVRENV
jgi:hypothetical protein